MATNEDIKELFERFMRIEGEIKTLQDDKKELLAEFKDRIEPSAFRSALRAAKIKSKVKPQDLHDYESILDQIEKRLCIEHID